LGKRCPTRGHQIHDLPFTSQNVTELIAAQPRTQAALAVRTSTIDGLTLSTINITRTLFLGARRTSLGRVVERAASQLGLKIGPDPQPEQGYFTRSDQYSFVKQGVPSVGISEGYEAKDPKVDGKKLTGEWTAIRYHKPSDDMSQPMDLNAAVQFMHLHFLVGYDIANDPQRPRWNPGDFFGELSDETRSLRRPATIYKTSVSPSCFDCTLL
jgi:peptidase M28-like protein